MPGAPNTSARRRAIAIRPATALRTSLRHASLAKSSVGYTRAPPASSAASPAPEAFREAYEGMPAAIVWSLTKR